MRDRDAAREQAEREEDEKLAQAPVASLMFEEVERRIDVFIFRCCFAHSVYEARRLVIHGRVKLNGKKVRILFSRWDIFTKCLVARQCEHAPCAGRHGLCRP